MKGSSAVLMVLVVTLMVSGQILFKLAANNMKTTDVSIQAMLRVFLEPLLWPALVVYGLATILWIAVLRNAELSFAYPILIATSILLVSFAGAVLFQESFSTMKLAGIGIIMVGLAVLAVSG
jgi:multidrug transporter EmrE-like cation transporter